MSPTPQPNPPCHSELDSESILVPAKAGIDSCFRRNDNDRSVDFTSLQRQVVVNKSNRKTAKNTVRNSVIVFLKSFFKRYC